MPQKTPIIVKIILAMVGIIAFFVILTQARNFLYPIFLGVLMAYLLLPIAAYLEKIKVPRPIAILLSIIFGMTVIGGVVFFLYNRLTFFLEDIPTLRINATNNIDTILNEVEADFGLSVESQKNWLRQNINDFFESGTGNLISAFSATTTTIFAIGIMPVYVFFMLFYRNKFRNFILMITGKGTHEKTKTVLEQISNVTQRYVGGVVTVVLILCVLNSVGLMIIGIKYAIMFGILSALMNLIPYFGTLIGGTIPLTFTLFSDTPEKALGIVILYLIIGFVDHNILTPNITGGAVQINPFFTILSLVIGGIVWGIPGMLIAVPILGTVKIVFENISELHPYAYLMGLEGPRRYLKLGKRFKGGLPKKAA
jgi:predicted PurR-regulated permease PerM